MFVLSLVSPRCRDEDVCAAPVFPEGMGGLCPAAVAPPAPGVGARGALRRRRSPEVMAAGP